MWIFVSVSETMVVVVGGVEGQKKKGGTIPKLSLNSTLRESVNVGHYRRHCK